MDTTEGLRVEVLGPLLVTYGTVSGGASRALEIPGARLRALLVRLALERGRPVSPGTLIEDLWGTDAPASELNALQSLVSRLRRAVQLPDAVPQSAGGYQLRLAPSGLDVDRFRHLATTGRARLQAGDATRARQALGEALEVWRGPVASEVGTVAPGLPDVLEEQRHEVVLDQLEADLRLGRAGTVLDELTLLRSQRPVSERLAELEMRALVACGRSSDALRTFEQIRAELAATLGVDPSRRLREAHLAALRGTDGSDPNGSTASGAGSSTPGAASPATPRAAPAGNLPAAITSFVGRAADLRHVAERLSVGRLVTIVGPGGAGKTRLAIEAARERQDGTGNDAWFAELAGVTDEADVAQAVLAVLGGRDTAILDRRTSRPARETLDLLVERLRVGPALLVLDNCEHVIGAAAQLADTLLASCPELTVLTTSREPLAIAGEFLVPLPPLPVPDQDGSGADGSSGPEADGPALQLFVDRAVAATPGFRLDETTRGAAVEIVRGLDGLPLAIELAAARMRTLPVTEIAARLGDRFRLLTSGSRTADARHRTLRAVVAWSWDLLGPAERLLAERVAVFPAGLTRASAVAVCADPGLEPGLTAAVIPDLLDALVEKSLLQLSRDGMRYRVLETIRAYGQERLVERDELQAVRLAAARHFAMLAAEADPHLRTADQLEWLDRLRAEHDNIVAALRTFCEAGDANAALALALDFGWYWFLLGRYSEAGSWADEALRLPGPADEDLRRGARLIAALNLLAATDRDAEGQDDLLNRLIQETSEVRDDGRVLVTLFVPIVLFLAQDVAGARRRLDALVAADDAWLSAAARVMRARFAENAGDLPLVRADAEAALAAFRGLGDRWGVVTTLPMTGLLRIYDGDLDGALEAFLEAQAVSAVFGSLDVDDEFFLALRIADVRLRRGEAAEARAALDTTRRAVGQRGGAESRVIFEALSAGFERVLGDLTGARELQRRAEATLAEVRGGPLTAGHGIAVVGTNAAMLALTDGDVAGAAQHLEAAYAAGVRARDFPILAMVGVAVADLALAAGLPRDAAEILGASARLRGADDPTHLDIVRIRRGARMLLDAEDESAAHAAGLGLDVAAATARLDPARLGGAGAGPGLRRGVALTSGALAESSDQALRL